MSDERQLIQRAQHGDGDAFGRLVERSKVTTYRLAYDLTGNRQDAEDVLQEAYLRAYRGLSGFRGDAKWTSWMHRITVNCYLDRRRSERQTMEFDETIDGTNGETMPTGMHTSPPRPDRAAESGLIREHVDRALDRLGAKERAVFVLRHYQDLPLREIAGALGIAEGTVKVHLFRAIRRLQRELRFLRTDIGIEGERR